MNSKPLHIFIVDDDDDDRFIFENALKETGIAATLSQITNGVELLSFLNSTLPSIIFLDINMPLIDGIAVLERIQTNDSFKNVPIIVLSTSDNPHTVRSAYQLGARLYLKKPDKYEDYIRLIRFILSGTEACEVDITAFIRR